MIGLLLCGGGIVYREMWKRVIPNERDCVHWIFFFHHENFVFFFSVDFWLLFFVVVIKLIRKSGKFLTCASTQHCRLRLCAFYLLDETQISGFHPIALVLNYAYIYIFLPDSNSRATLCAIVIVIACDFVYFTAMRTR